MIHNGIFPDSGQDPGGHTHRQRREQGDQVDLQSNGDPVLEDLKYRHVGAHLSRCSPIPVKENVLKKITVLFDDGLVKMIFRVQRVDNCLGQIASHLIHTSRHEPHHHERDGHDNKQGDNHRDDSV